MWGPLAALHHGGAHDRLRPPHDAEAVEVNLAVGVLGSVAPPVGVGRRGPVLALLPLLEDVGAGADGVHVVAGRVLEDLLRGGDPAEIDAPRKERVRRGGDDRHRRRIHRFGGDLRAHHLADAVVVLVAPQPVDADRDRLAVHRAPVVELDPFAEGEVPAGGLHLLPARREHGEDLVRIRIDAGQVLDDVAKPDPVDFLVGDLGLHRLGLLVRDDDELAAPSHRVRRTGGERRRGAIPNTAPCRVVSRHFGCITPEN